MFRRVKSWLVGPPADTAAYYGQPAGFRPWSEMPDGEYHGGYVDQSMEAQPRGPARHEAAPQWRKPRFQYGGGESPRGDHTGQSHQSYGRQAHRGYENVQNNGGRDVKGQWHTVLGCSPDASAREVKRAYHAQAARYHPDAGGSNEAFRAINDAYNEARNR
jgi:curved DNA-binding protein CbpA